MSLEESMLKLAASNDNLAAAQNRLADAQEKVADKYDEMIAFVVANGGGEVKTPAAKTEAAKEDKAPAKGKGGRPKKDEQKPAPAAATDDDDGFGEDDDSGTAEEALDFATVKAKLLEVRDVTGDKSHALKIIDKHGGYKALPEIQEKDFRKIYDAACKIIADHE